MNTRESTQRFARADELIRYGEEHNVDISTEAGLMRALSALGCAMEMMDTRAIPADDTIGYAVGLEANEIIRYADEHRINIDSGAGMREVIDAMSRQKTVPTRAGTDPAPRDHEPDGWEIVRYSEEHKIDIDSEAGLQRVIAALSKPKTAPPRIRTDPAKWVPREVLDGLNAG